MLGDERLEINTRSGNGANKNIVVANTIGWVDASYYNNSDNEGEIIVALRNEGTLPFTVNKGDRYCQACFSKYLVADFDVIANKQRTGGLGSSGN
jgi:dUTP pyrophosphatase